MASMMPLAVKRQDFKAAFIALVDALEFQENGKDVSAEAARLKGKGKDQVRESNMWFKNPTTGVQLTHARFKLFDRNSYIQSRNKSYSLSDQMINQFRDKLSQVDGIRYQDNLASGRSGDFTLWVRIDGGQHLNVFIEHKSFSRLQILLELRSHAKKGYIQKSRIESWIPVTAGY